MSEENKQELSARQKRVRRLKHLIIITLFTMIAAPIVCCVILMFQVRDLNRRIDGLAERIARLEQITAPESQIPDSSDVGGAVGSRPADVGQENPQEDLPVDSRRKVYLTFDDGPSIYTDEILDILAEYDVKATFFVVGKEDEHSREALARIVEEGHTLGMHSYSHKYSELYASLESFEADFEKQKNYLEEVTGATCRFYRFPGGSSNTVSREDMHIFIDYLEDRGMVFFDWNISSGDGSKPLLDVDTLVKNSTEDVEFWNTAVILMHDSASKRTTVDALPQIIENILAMEDTVILPITDETEPIQHIH